MPETALPMKAEKLLPHKGLMCCIDSLLSIDETWAKGEAKLHEAHPLLEDNILNSLGYIELAAQTAGAMQGYAQLLKKEEPKTGYLVGVQNFEVYKEAKKGDKLNIRVKTLAELEGISVLFFEVFCTDELMAQGRLKVYLDDKLSL